MWYILAILCVTFGKDHSHWQKANLRVKRLSGCRLRILHVILNSNPSVGSHFCRTKTYKVNNQTQYGQVSNKWFLRSIVHYKKCQSTHRMQLPLSDQSNYWRYYALSTVQSSTPTWIHNAILFNNQQSMTQGFSLANDDTMFDDNC